MVTILDTDVEEDLFSPEFVEQLEHIKLPATKLEVLVKLLRKSIAAYKNTNKITAEKYEELLKKRLEEYHNRRTRLSPQEASSAQSEAIDEIIRQDAARKAGENGDKLCAGIQKLIDKYDLPFVTWNTGSIVHFEVSGVMYLSVTDPDIFTKIPQRQKYIEEFGAALTANGVITLAGSRIYTSMADNDETIAQTLNAFEDVFSNVEH